MNKTFQADIVLVGSGAGGATVAKELAGCSKKILLVERGRVFEKPGHVVKCAVSCYDKCALSKSVEGFIIYRNLTAGGTTISTSP